jgi:AcrR family transcriptional regulator
MKSMSVYSGYDAGVTSTPRRRDAAQTRQLLLEEAGRRFARDGYASTTVRDIADGAGVNVALINRYFTSKEGLFEACLTHATTDLKKVATGVGPADIAASMARRIAGSPEDSRLDVGLLLLLRTSGDERIDGLRRGLIRSLSERLAAARVEDPGDDALLRAQIVLATALGIAVLRASIGAQPLAAAGEEDLRAPLTDLISALLPREQPQKP